VDRALLYYDARRSPSSTIGAITYIDANNLDLDAIFEMPVGVSPDAPGFHDFSATADQGLSLELLSLRGGDF